MGTRYPIVLVIGPQGGNILSRFGGSIAGIRIRDCAGYDSDECEMRIRMMPPYMERPKAGTLYSVSAAWSDGIGGSYQGKFAVARVTFAGGAGDGYEMTVSCRSADFKKELLTVGSDHFDDLTFGDIVDKVAKKAGYTAVVDPDLKAIKIKYRLRSGQSRIDFLSDLATDFGGALKVQDEKIIITKRGKGTSSSGADLPVIEPFVIGDEYSHEIEFDDRGDFAETEVCYHDPKSGRRKRHRAKGSDTGTGRHGRTHPAASKDEAEAQAEAEKRERLRRTIQGYFEMPGTPTAFAGAKVKPSGYGADIDGAQLIAEEVEHEIDPDGGWKTIVTVERATD